jgi:hypothetical protein
LNLNIVLFFSFESLYCQLELLFQFTFSAAGAAFSVASVSSEPLSESPSTIAAKDKILSIDLEHHLMELQTYSRGSELVSTIAKTGMFLSFFRCVQP